MRQLVDLAVWMGMIVVAVGVVYYTPIVADYFMTDSRPTIEVGSELRLHQTIFHTDRGLGESASSH